jgi:hypothetical protein
MTYDLFQDRYLPLGGGNDIPNTGGDTPAYAYMNGTFSSGDPLSTSNTTDISARAAWHFLQSFLSAFPQYNPGVQPNSSNVSTTGINLFAESYGGTYGPTFANYFEEQNTKRENGTIPKNSTLEIKLASLGIVNGLIDSLIQDYYYATFAYNNTFGIQTISQTDELNLIEQYNNECSKETIQCRAIANGTDPEGGGDSPQANMACQTAVYDCNSLMGPFEKSNLSVYDIRVENPSPDPPNAYLEYLNTASVQKAIGARVNYTTSSNAVFNAFIRTGDSMRGGQIQDIANLLRAGVRVSLMYGDADYIVSFSSPPRCGRDWGDNAVEMHNNFQDEALSEETFCRMFLWPDLWYGRPSCISAMQSDSLNHMGESDFMTIGNADIYASATGRVARLLLSLSQLRSRTFLQTAQDRRTSLAGTVRAMQILSSTQLMSEELYVSSATSRSAESTMLDIRYRSINQRQPLPSLLASSMALTLARERRST